MGAFKIQKPENLENGTQVFHEIKNSWHVLQMTNFEKLVLCGRNKLKEQMQKMTLRKTFKS